jgi:hypothetical protein
MTLRARAARRPACHSRTARIHRTEYESVGAVAMYLNLENKDERIGTPAVSRRCFPFVKSSPRAYKLKATNAPYLNGGWDNAPSSTVTDKEITL